MQSVQRRAKMWESVIKFQWHSNLKAVNQDSGNKLLPGIRPPANSVTSPETVCRADDEHMLIRRIPCNDFNTKRGLTQR